MDELTYLEHITSKLKLEKEKLNQSLRNIDLRNSDIELEILTKDFFDRTDISDRKKELIKEINDNVTSLQKELDRIS